MPNQMLNAKTQYNNTFELFIPNQKLKPSIFIKAVFLCKISPLFKLLKFVSTTTNQYAKHSQAIRQTLEQL